GLRLVVTQSGAAGEQRAGAGEEQGGAGCGPGCRDGRTRFVLDRHVVASNQKTGSAARRPPSTIAWYTSARSFAWSSILPAGMSCVRYTTTSSSRGSTQ